MQEPQSKKQKTADEKKEDKKKSDRKEDKKNKDDKVKVRRSMHNVYKYKKNSFWCPHYLRVLMLSNQIRLGVLHN